MALKDKFATANSTSDGHLTKAQAEAGGLKSIAKHFAKIDTQGVGFLTLDQVRGFRKEQKAKKAAKAPKPTV